VPGTGDLENYANGTVWGQQTVVQVRWAWLAGPVAFSAISLFFFLVVAVLGHLHHTSSPPKWKSSSMAMLNGLDPQLHSKLGAMVLRSTMDNRAKNLDVRLVQKGGGWRLVEAAEEEYIALRNEERYQEALPEVLY
jgi:hypothetical protein